MYLNLPAAIEILRNLDDDAFVRSTAEFTRLATVPGRVMPPNDRMRFVASSAGYYSSGMMTGLAYAAHYLRGCLVSDVWRDAGVDYRVTGIMGVDPLYVTLERLPAPVKVSGGVATGGMFGAMFGAMFAGVTEAP